MPTSAKHTMPICAMQFPVRLAFAMTINKAQGQTLGRVGVCLDVPCFSHGQLYVAASRVGNPDNIRFSLEPNDNGDFCTPNIVYREALSAAPRVAQYTSATCVWGDFDADSGEHRSLNNEHGRCCSPLTNVPEDVYINLSEAAIVQNNIVCARDLNGSLMRLLARGFDYHFRQIGASLS